MNDLKIEFKRHLVFDSFYYSLYINGDKTNIYYPEKPSCMNLNTKEQAEKEAEMIRTGQVKPASGSFENFDFCDTYFTSFENIAECVIKPDYKNVIQSCTTPQPITEARKEEIKKELRRQTKVWTQTTKRISKDYNRILENVGIYFYPYGYDVFFF